MHNKFEFLKKRNLLGMLFLLIITCGLYLFYWIYQTKNEINKLGGTIPPFWFFILPFFNIYFMYRYGQDFVRFVREEDDKVLEWGFFALLLLVPAIAPFIIQYELNNKASRN